MNDLFPRAEAEASHLIGLMSFSPQMMLDLGSVYSMVSVRFYLPLFFDTDEAIIISTTIYALCFATNVRS